MGTRYPQVYEGDVVRPVMTGYKMRCCDCSLVHVLNFEIVEVDDELRVEFTAFRDNRATAACRRKG